MDIQNYPIVSKIAVVYNLDSVRDSKLIKGLHFLYGSAQADYIDYLNSEAFATVATEKNVKFNALCSNFSPNQKDGFFPFVKFFSRQPPRSDDYAKKLQALLMAVTAYADVAPVSSEVVKAAATPIIKERIIQQKDSIVAGMSVIEFIRANGQLTVPEAAALQIKSDTMSKLKERLSTDVEAVGDYLKTVYESLTK